MNAPEKSCEAKFKSTICEMDRAKLKSNIEVGFEIKGGDETISVIHP